MDTLTLMKERHSVRSYQTKTIPPEIKIKLVSKIQELNRKSTLSMQLFFDEPECFKSTLAHYGHFSHVTNYLAIVGHKHRDEEKAGYYGETFVLYAQSLGLHSCFVGLTHGKSAATIGQGEKQFIVIAFGYGAEDGHPHKSKPMDTLCHVDGIMPSWFKKGMEAAMLAPTAMNQQKFFITYQDGLLKAEVKGRGFFTQMDLGIVKYHFETISGHKFEG